MWDTFEGIGLSIGDGRKEDPGKWKGRNRGALTQLIENLWREGDYRMR